MKRPVANGIDASALILSDGVARVTIPFNDRERRESGTRYAHRQAASPHEELK
jgi:hypothetical protein